jgi:hypothetical protein
MSTGPPAVGPLSHFPAISQSHPLLLSTWSLGKTSGQDRAWTNTSASSNMTCAHIRQMGPPLMAPFDPSQFASWHPSHFSHSLGARIIVSRPVPATRTPLEPIRSLGLDQGDGMQHGTVLCVGTCKLRQGPIIRRRGCWSLHTGIMLALLDQCIRCGSRHACLRLRSPTDPLFRIKHY